jgi:3-methyladenine DNA glycosylase Mpg
MFALVFIKTLYGNPLLLGMTHRNEGSRKAVLIRSARIASIEDLLPECGERMLGVRIEIRWGLAFEF